MKAINIWMLSTVLFSGLMSCEMKEEIFGKEIPKETGYLTLDVSAGSSASLATKGATDQKEDFPLVIKAMDFDKFYEMAEPYIKKVITKDLDLKKIAAMVKTRIEIFPDIKEHIDFFEAVPEYDIAMYTHKKMKTTAETSLAVLKDVLPLMEAQEDYSNDALYAMLSSYVKENGYKNGYVMWPIRTALSGKQMTPGGATELMEVLGKDESIARIKAAIEKLAAEA